MNFEQVKQDYINKKVKIIDDLKDFDINKFFEKCAEHHLARFSWVQYTPYFNDGEPCEFGVDEEIKDMVIRIDDLGYANCEDEYETYDFIDGEKIFHSQQHKKAYEFRFRSALPLPDDLMLELFGDHKKVTVNVVEKTFDSNEYYHD